MDVEFVVCDDGRFFIVVNGVKSDITGYAHIARVDVDGQTYIGYSNYYDGALPEPNTVLALSPLQVLTKVGVANGY